VPLIEVELKKKILDIISSLSKIEDLEKDPNLISSTAASKFAEAYDSWVTSGFPIEPFKFVTLPLKSALAQAVRVPLFLPGWAPGLNSYWLSATIVGPGLVPINPLDPSNVPVVAEATAAAITELGLMLVTNFASADDFAKKLASILFRFTTGLVFLTTTATVPPVPAKLPVG
jgi:hypothetical protein